MKIIAWSGRKRLGQATHVTFEDKGGQVLDRVYFANLTPTSDDMFEQPIDELPLSMVTIGKLRGLGLEIFGELTGYRRTELLQLGLTDLETVELRDLLDSAGQVFDVTDEDSILELDLKPYTANILLGMGIETVAQLCSQSMHKLLHEPNGLGRKRLQEIRDALALRDYKLRP
jgi:hypothetical protein